MEKRDLLYEGKAKILYLTEDTDLLIQMFKDELTAFNGTKKGSFDGKGEICNAISTYLFEYLENYHVLTHFVSKSTDTEMVVKRLEMIPIEIVVRNIATANLSKTYNLAEGDVLQYPIIEYFLKDDQLGDPMINEHHAYAMGYATPEEMRMISRVASKVNAIFKSFFDRRGLLLVDFKLEFGKLAKNLLIGDEITPDTCRIWDKKTNKKMDKDRFRYDMGQVDKVYNELKDRILSAG
ncbi:MAG: phosphoribosylaminoimidazolesuccinocarboxamide synthase [Candidatus Electryonea clarkiae]|nr:phosphoribosylaminoimidazolesuccinocarboxamide synthase [Candidatus Electryonea clarkiae]MDP8286345.1 phosphoribosylaminoimidazolesuccinocarboxamide synthase [Candidatus Electryonea clarkiae]